MIPNIGPLEIAVVLILALVVFGPRRLPELGRSAGRGLKEFKGSLSGADPVAKESDPAENADRTRPGEPARNAEKA